jgi:hypothetical protein
MNNFLDYLNFHQEFKPTKPVYGTAVEEAWEKVGVYLRNAMDEVAKEHTELSQESSDRS